MVTEYHVIKQRVHLLCHSEEVWMLKVGSVIDHDHRFAEVLLDEEAQEEQRARNDAVSVDIAIAENDCDVNTAKRL